MTDTIDLIEPTTIDEARLQMVRQLHRAVYGDVWARPESPKQVWHRLLDVVRVACESTRPQPESGPCDDETSRFPGWYEELSRRVDRLERLLILTIGTAEPQDRSSIIEDWTTQYGDLRMSLVADIYERSQP